MDTNFQIQLVGLLALAVILMFAYGVNYVAAAWIAVVNFPANFICYLCRVRWKGTFLILFSSILWALVLGVSGYLDWGIVVLVTTIFAVGRMNQFRVEISGGYRHVD